MLKELQNNFNKHVELTQLKREVLEELQNRFNEQFELQNIKKEVLEELVELAELKKNILNTEPELVENEVNEDYFIEEEDFSDSLSETNETNETTETEPLTISIVDNYHSEVVQQIIQDKVKVEKSLRKRKKRGWWF